MKQLLLPLVAIGMAPFLLVGFYAVVRTDRIQTVDATTGVPVADVAVISKWQGELPGIVHSARLCVDIDIDVTGSSGIANVRKSAVSPLSIVSFYVQRQLYFYKPGYMPSGPWEEGTDGPPSIIRMKNTSAAIEGVLTNLYLLSAFAQCENAPQYRLLLIPLLRTIVRESQLVGDDDRNARSGKATIKYFLDVLGFGPVAAEEKLRSAQRMEEGSK